MFEYSGTPLKGRCAVVTSYDGKAPDLTEGYTDDVATEAEAQTLKNEVKDFDQIREAIMK